MIRKERKARWVYTCPTCDVTAVYPDQFRAIERQQRHERSVGHMATALSAAFEPVVEAIRDIGLAWAPTVRQLDALASALAPPTNLPYDPSLRRDLRKWGGR